LANPGIARERACVAGVAAHARPRSRFGPANFAAPILPSGLPAGCASATAGAWFETTPSMSCSLVDRCRDLDRPGEDRRAVPVDPADDRAGPARADPAEPDSTVGQIPDAVPARSQLALRERLDRQIDVLAFCSLEYARQDLRTEERLVDVDADPPDVL